VPPFSAEAAGWALLPLRAFVGVTFVFAGLQKLANPGFFDASNPTSIQSQMKEAASNSPIHALVAPLEHVAVAVGVILALGELAVGLGTVLGLWSRLAALGGIVISASLFLTVSFHASPYYTGSDIVFVVAWLPLLVAGSGGVLSVDAALAPRPRAASTTPGPAPARPDTLDRRAFALKGLALAGAGALGMALAGLAAGLGRLVGHTPSPSAGSAPVTTPSTTAAPGSGATTSPSTTVTTPPGRKVLAAAAVAPGGSAPFTDPKTGEPAVVVQPTSGTFVAFDAVCPHEGCTVAYSEAARLFICPCHGSRFNGTTGALVHGPATRGLTRIAIAEGPDGELYAI